MAVDIALLPTERRLAPGLVAATAAPNTDLILELCDNADRNLSAILAEIRPALDALQVQIEPITDKRLKARIQGTTAPVKVAESLIELLSEVVWVEKKAPIALL